MLNAAIVKEVARTAEPAFVSGWSLTVDNLIRRTRGSDWESGYYRMRPAAARRVADEINRERPWNPPVPALPAAQAIKAVAAASGVSYDLEGEAEVVTEN